MNFDDEPDHIRAYAHSSKHRVSIQRDTQCGCFYCLAIFPPSAITAWRDEEEGEQTAVCPYCGVDSVIGASSGFSITAAFLHRMCEYWFSSDQNRGANAEDDPHS